MKKDPNSVTRRLSSAQWQGLGECMPKVRKVIQTNSAALSPSYVRDQPVGHTLYLRCFMRKIYWQWLMVSPRALHHPVSIRWRISVIGTLSTLLYPLYLVSQYQVNRKTNQVCYISSLSSSVQGPCCLTSLTPFLSIPRILQSPCWSVYQRCMLSISTEHKVS